MDITKLLTALFTEFVTTGKASVPSYWTVGDAKINVNLNIVKGTDGRLEFVLSLPAVDIKL